MENLTSGDVKLFGGEEEINVIKNSEIVLKKDAFLSRDAISSLQSGRSISSSLDIVLSSKEIFFK